MKSQFEVNIFPVIRNRCLVLYWDLVFGSYSKNIIGEMDVYIVIDFIRLTGC